MGMLKKVWHRWRKLAFKIGTIQARIILTLFYFSILLPFSSLVTLLSDRMHKKRPVKSMWQGFTEEYQTFEAAKRQF